MQLKILIVGKPKNKNLISEIEELKKRISRIEVIELKEVKDSNVEVIKNKEFELIEKHLNPEYFNVLLWEFGEMFSTKRFYEKLKKIEKPIQFIITGPYGASNELRERVNMILSLSKMTFTHEQAYYMLIEQLYRVECFKKGIDYTK
jgi:23S rRNA (pseudouridine1915-N3)-methyltransferase